MKHILWEKNVTTVTFAFLIGIINVSPYLLKNISSNSVHVIWDWRTSECPCERVTGRKARGSPNGGKRLQVPDIFISLKRQEETNQLCFFFSIQIQKEVSLKMLCCHDTWFHLNLTTLKPWVNQYISFSYGIVVLSSVNVPQTLSSSWFCQMAQPSYSDCEWLYNNNVSCLRTVFGLNPLANSVILKHKLWE